MFREIRPTPNKKDKVEMFMARQSFATDLPIFSGDPVEWPYFIKRFKKQLNFVVFPNKKMLTV